MASPYFFFILSTCCITVLDIPGFINRTAFGRETKLSKVDMTNCFYFRKLCFFPCFFFFFFISRTAIRDLHCCNGWLFCFFGLLCFFFP
jgi:hypothetical protein